MKIKILCILFLLTSISSFSQSELYVLQCVPKNTTNIGTSCKICGYGNSYVISYRQGNCQIASNTANIKVIFQEGHNDNSEHACNNTCGYYSEICDVKKGGN